MNTQLQRALVIVDPDRVNPAAPMESVLIARSVALAKATGCELELFHVCYDGALDQKLFASDETVAQEKERFANHAATRLSEVAIALQSQGVAVRCDVRWDSPRVDAILRKVNAYGADVVLKESGEHGYVLGLISNTDWDLIRHSPAHVWFVKPDRAAINRLVTAVGCIAGTDEIISESDYAVFRVARTIAAALQAENLPVHAYQVPRTLPAYSTYAPNLGGLSFSGGEILALEQTRREVEHRHGQSIRAFADSFELDPDRVTLLQGDASRVLTEFAVSSDADLIVMGARSLNDWERAMNSVTAEPVLARASCDVLFVRDGGGANADQRERPIRGVPAFDLEQAIIDPQRAFGTPNAVADAHDLSIGMRRRILQAWEQDVRAQMVEEDEGGLVQRVDAGLLGKIDAARSRLSTEDAQVRQTAAD